MSELAKAAILFFCFFLIVAGTMSLAIHFGQRVHAQETQEVRPYVFAELPHGRIYKTVHEGCELFITESDLEPAFGNQYAAMHAYSVATGRGCK